MECRRQSSPNSHTFIKDNSPLQTHLNCSMGDGQKSRRKRSERAKQKEADCHVPTESTAKKSDLETMLSGRLSSVQREMDIQSLNTMDQFAQFLL